MVSISQKSKIVLDIVLTDLLVARAASERDMDMEKRGKKEKKKFLLYLGTVFHCICTKAKYRLYLYLLYLHSSPLYIFPI